MKRFYKEVIPIKNTTSRLKFFNPVENLKKTSLIRKDGFALNVHASLREAGNAFSSFTKSSFNEEKSQLVGGDLFESQDNITCRDDVLESPQIKRNHIVPRVVKSIPMRSATFKRDMREQNQNLGLIQLSRFASPQKKADSFRSIQASVYLARKERNFKSAKEKDFTSQLQDKGDNDSIISAFRFAGDKDISKFDSYRQNDDIHEILKKRKTEEQRKKMHARAKELNSGDLSSIVEAGKLFLKSLKKDDQHLENEVKLDMELFGREYDSMEQERIQEAHNFIRDNRGAFSLIQQDDKLTLAEILSKINLKSKFDRETTKEGNHRIRNYKEMNLLRKLLYSHFHRKHSFAKVIRRKLLIKKFVKSIFACSLDVHRLKIPVNSVDMVLELLIEGKLARVFS